MRGAKRVRVGAVLALAAGSLLAATVASAARERPPLLTAACTTATAACTEWVPLGQGGARAMVYRTFPLTARNTHVRRALVMVHGTLRNADHYFTTATGAGFLARALDDTLIIAPAIRSAQGACKDTLAPNEVSWSCSGDSWRSGGASPSHPELTSFDFMDQILRQLADKRVFPNLRRIVVAGHSAGGQFVSRYEMANTVHDRLGVPVSYVVANPSSYAWPASVRPLPVDDAAPANAAVGWDSETLHTKFSYGAFDPAAAANFNRWPFGFEGRTGYAARLSDDELRAHLAQRTTTYLFGQVDTLPLGGFDSSPQAMAQGPTRRARGEAFVRYLNEHLGGTAKAQIVPECGHNDRCVFTTDGVLPVIFPPS